MEAQDNQHSQPLYLIPAREHVPMEVREARSSRFVSLLAGATALVKLPKLSKAQRLWLRGVEDRKVAGLPVVVDPHPLTYSDPQVAPANLPRQG